MSELTQAQPPRVRANASEQKAGFTVEVTVECFQGENAAARLAQKVTEVQKALRDAGLKLVSDAA